jgi:hypothetical protein
MSYKLLKPCVVPGKDGQNATSYRRLGETVEVHSEEDADRLVRGGFIEKVEEDGDPGNHARLETGDPEVPDNVKDPEPGSAATPASDEVSTTATDQNVVPDTMKDPDPGSATGGRPVSSTAANQVAGKLGQDAGKPSTGKPSTGKDRG